MCLEASGEEKESTEERIEGENGYDAFITL